jgi:hypothetical protein
MKTGSAPAFAVTTKIWRVEEPGGWFFVTIDKKTAQGIRFFSEGETVGLGYVKVRATLGSTSWETTLFPTKAGEYLLAIKAAVRKAENVSDGDRVQVRLELL